MIGLSLALYGIGTAFVQGVLTGPILARLGERRTVILGHLFDMGSFATLAFLTHGPAALVLTPVMTIGSVLSPALQGLMSHRAGDDRQGELQGVLASLHALAMIVAPLVMTAIFAAATAEGGPVDLPGAPFLVSMVLMGAALAVFLRGRATAA